MATRRRSSSAWSRQAEHWRGRADSRRHAARARDAAARGRLRRGCRAGGPGAGVPRYRFVRRRYRGEAARVRADSPGARRSQGDADGSRRVGLPFDDASFHHVWMMWFLEHVPIRRRRFARRDASSSRRSDHRDRGRLLDEPRGAVDAVGSRRSSRRWFRAWLRRTERRRYSSARWLREAGFRDVDPGRASVLVAGRGARGRGELCGGRHGERARLAPAASWRRRAAAARRPRGPAPGSSTPRPSRLGRAQIDGAEMAPRTRPSPAEARPRRAEPAHRVPGLRTRTSRVRAKEATSSLPRRRWRTK